MAPPCMPSLFAPPLMRDASMAPKYEVLKAIFSTMPIANSGKTAQRIGARFAHAESREGRPGTRAWRLAEHRESRSVIAREARLKRSCRSSVVEAPSAAAPPAAPDGIHKIKHVVIVMQENRSFDSYFGTFPGVDGLPRDSHGNFTTNSDVAGQLLNIERNAVHGSDAPETAAIEIPFFFSLAELL